jgi:hypothetical protein
MKELIEIIKVLTKKQEVLAKQAVQQYQPLVVKYINDNCIDIPTKYPTH